MITHISDTIQVHVARLDSRSGEYEFLLLKRSDDKIPYPGLWQVVTGRIEENETALQAATRELFEETGLKAEKLWVVPYIASFFNARKDQVNSSPVFGVIVPEDSKVLLSDEHQAYKWLGYHGCIVQLELPSHKEGSTIFYEYILLSDRKERFLVGKDRD